MGFKLKSSKNDPMSEINVTPFVDVMLVLLIIFMVTAPLLTVGVQVDLPETSADTLPEENEPLTLTINSKGEIFIQETKVEFNNLIVKILAVSNNRTDTRIYVRGDKVHTDINEIYEVKKKFEKVIANFLSTEIEWLPINKVSLKGEENQNMVKFLETLEDEDDVQNVYTNVEFEG